MTVHPVTPFIIISLVLLLSALARHAGVDPLRPW